jgi:hypothetical protein
MKYFLIATALFISMQSIAQIADNTSKNKFNKKDIQVWVDVSPIFFLGGAYASFGAGAEYNRFQFGVNIVRANSLNKQFTEGIFTKIDNLQFGTTKSEEIVLKTFLKRSRKGFYLGLLANFTEYDLKETITNKTLTIASTNLDAFAGYRVFPFKKIFYIDGGFGISKNISSKATKMLGNESFAFQNKVDFLPFLSLGARFSLFK